LVSLTNHRNDLIVNTPAIAYYRTSSAANVGGDSDQRQREAIQRYAEASGLAVVAEFYDAAVSGADPIDERQGFSNLLAFAKEQGIGVVVVETANRFARSLMADSPSTFTAEDDPMVVAVRQMLGVMAQLDKAMTVAKLKGARDRASEQAGKRVEGRKGYDDTNKALVREAKRLARKSPKTGKARSLREIARELEALGFTTKDGKTFAAAQVQRLINYNLN
jgi:DNA invertase Pin-like site-specific DNA recombinase